MAALHYQRHGPDHLVTTDLGVHFLFARVVEHRDEITGMLRVFTLGVPGRADGDIYDDRIVLTGERSKPACAKTCERRCPEIPGWADLIDDVCRLVRREIARGEPFLDMSVGEAEAEAPWLVRPILRQDEHAVLFGSGGTGKSTAAMALELCLSLGIEQWGFGISEAMKVGYIDFEDSESSFRRRLAMLARGLDLPERPHIWYKRGESSLSNIAESLSRQCKDLGITGLVIDSAGLACGTEPETADSANAYFRALRALPISWSLTIAHQPKDKERSNMPFGSVFWWNNPRTIWKATTQSEEGKDSLDVGLSHRKSNNGRIEKPIGLHLDYRDDKITISQREASIPRESRSQPEQVRDVLERAGRPMTTKELMFSTGIKESSLGVVLSRMGNLVQHSKEGYSLIFPGLSEPPLSSQTYGTESLDDIPFG